MAAESQGATVGNMLKAASERQLLYRGMSQSAQTTLRREKSDGS
jgi:hypothetical protein